MVVLLFCGFLFGWGVCLFFFSTRNPSYKVKSLYVVINTFTGCFWICIGCLLVFLMLLTVLNVLLNASICFEKSARCVVAHELRYPVIEEISKVALNVLAGEVPKQVKVKKLKNLKTLDSKPGNKLLQS